MHVIYSNLYYSRFTACQTSIGIDFFRTHRHIPAGLIGILGTVQNYE